MKTNRVQLIGYVGSDLSAATTSKGNKRVNMRVATHHPVKGDQGDTTWLTVWHDVVAWDSTAEYGGRSFVKGSRIMVEGSIEYRSYPDRTGHIRYITQIKAHSLMNLDR